MHPVTFSLDDEAPDGELKLRYPYFETGEPLHWSGDGDYADASATFEHQASYEWNHSLG